MKILAIVGSYRKNGNTDQMVRLILERMAQLAAAQQVLLDVETVYLGHPEVQPCRGCRVCFDRGEEKCPVRDDLLAIKAKMLAADGVLAAAPVYVDDVNGLTKNWIDRLAHLCHRPVFAGKCAYLVTTVGSGPTGHSLRTLNLALSTWGFHIAGQLGVKMGALMKAQDSAAQFGKQADKAARSLFNAISRKQYTQPTFLALLMFRIYQSVWQGAKFNGTLDQRYWQENGWFDPHKTFYIAHRANLFKVGAARLAGGVIGRFVS